MLHDADAREGQHVEAVLGAVERQRIGQQLVDVVTGRVDQAEDAAAPPVLVVLLHGDQLLHHLVAGEALRSGIGVWGNVAMASFLAAPDAQRVRVRGCRVAWPPCRGDPREVRRHLRAHAPPPVGRGRRGGRPARLRVRLAARAPRAAGGHERFPARRGHAPTRARRPPSSSTRPPYLSFIAARTTSLRLGTYVYLLGLRHPFVTARAFATLDWVSGGRAVIGAGAGWLQEEWRALGIDPATRGARLDEAIVVCRRLWTEETVANDGPCFPFAEVAFEPKPVQQPIPILIGGESAPALRRAGRLGDGWIGMSHTPDVRRRRGGRHPGPPRGGRPARRSPSRSRSAASAPPRTTWRPGPTPAWTALIVSPWRRSVGGARGDGRLLGALHRRRVRPLPGTATRMKASRVCGVPHRRTHSKAEPPSGALELQMMAWGSV